MGRSLAVPTGVTFLLALVAPLLPALAAASTTEAETRVGYRAVLEVLAGGDQKRALSELAAFELDALGDRPAPRDVERFWRSKLGLIRELLEASTPELLVPIIVLHHDAYSGYMEDGRFGLARHARLMASELAQIYSDRSTASDSGPAASRILTSLGGYLQEGWSLSAAQALFERAIELDPENETAHLGLAANFEKVGSYEEALPALDAALRLDRDNSEAWLRGALCLKRTGDLERAESKLRDLVEERPDEWILSVAYQEIANIQLSQGDSERALAVLAEGLERMPGNQQLTIQRALLLDRAGKPIEAARLLEALQPTSAEGDTARYHYNRWPVAWMARTREAVRRAAELKRPALEQALAASGAAPIAGEGRSGG